MMDAYGQQLSPVIMQTENQLELLEVLDRYISWR